MASGRLGSGRNEAFIYDRRGESQLLKLPKKTAVTWGRALSATSNGEVVIAATNCVPELDNFHPWAHSLVIIRDPRTGAPPARAWEGPIKRRTDPAGAAGALTISAADVLGWTERRQVLLARKDNSAAVTDELAWTLTHAFNQDDPNVLPFMEMVGSATGGNISRDLAPRASMHSDDIASLTGAGGAFTVLGRSILYFADITLLGRTPTLVPERHLLAQVEVIEDGDLLATEVTASDDNNGRRTAGGVDPYYGLVSTIVSVGGNKRRAGLQRRAEALLAQSSPQPLTINVPQTAQLRPDAPFPIELLVPGALVPLETTTATGRVVRADFVLTAVDVTETADGDESVGITLGPLTTGASVAES